MSSIMKGIIVEEVGGNYLYHATSAEGLKSILQSGTVRRAAGPQKATQAQTNLPTVSMTRDWGYAAGNNSVEQYQGISRSAVLVFDRAKIENNYKSLATSQSHDIRGLANAKEPHLAGRLRYRDIAMRKASGLNPQDKQYFATPKAGGEFEEAVVVPKGGLPIKGTLVGFWVNPESSLTKDPKIMNNPFRLDKTGPNKFVKAAQSQPVNEEDLDENLRKWFKEKWVRFGPDGKIRGPCARGDDSEGKPKCLPQKKAQNLGNKGRKYAASKKRREDPNPERTGKAKNVATKKKTNEDIPFNECPSCRGPIVHESMMNEKQDACYHKVKSRYKVWPSAYASGALVQCRKKGASNWGNGGKKSESSIMKGIVDEARAKQYVKPYNDPQTGEQIGWVSSDGYHKKYWQKFAKDSAIKHAKLNPDEVDEGKLTEGWKMGTLGTIAGLVFGVSHNPESYLPLATMVAGGYFGKDISSLKDLVDRFTKNPVAFKKLIKQRKAENKKNKRSKEMTSAIDILNGVVSQLDLVIQATTNKQYKKAANIFSSGDLNPGILGLFPNLVYALESLSDAEESTLFIPEIRYALEVYEKFKTSPNDYAPEFIQALGEFKQYLVNRIQEAQIDEDYTGEFAAEKTPAINPYGGLKDNKFRGAISEEPTNNPTGASGEGGTRRYRPKPAGTFNEDLSQADVDSIARFADKLYKKLGIDVTFTKHFMDRVNDKRNGKPISGAELVRLFKKEYERWGKDVAQMGPDMEGTFKDLTTDINLPFVLRWDRDEEELDLVAKTVMRKKNFKTDNQEFPVDEGEEQLDEKCWDTHKQVGMKNKGGKKVPNCVPKESAIMKGLSK